MLDNARLLFFADHASLDADRAGVSELMSVRARRGGAAREGWAATPRRARAQRRELRQLWSECRRDQCDEERAPSI